MANGKNYFESDEYLNDPVDPKDGYLEHYGTPRHSGRYPWGSGKNPQRGKDINTRATELKKKGFSERERANILGYKTTSELRAALAVGAAARDSYEIGYLQKLYDQGMGYSEIGRKVGLNESSVRSKLNRKKSHAQEVLDTTVDILKKQIDDSGEYLDIGKGTDLYLGVSKSRLDTAVELLKKQGYTEHKVKVQQLGTGNETTMRVLAPPKTSWAEVQNNKDKIHIIQETGAYVDDSGDIPETKKLHNPKKVDLSRVYIRYPDEGGVERDGTIELRRGVDDLNLGQSNYAQVRIKVGDKDHEDGYMKGMAFYSENIPDGYDIVYNTNRSRGSALFKQDAEKGKDSVFKRMDPSKSDKEVDQFGALIERQSDWKDADGKDHEGALNIIREEGKWTEWSKTIAAQMLSKQSVPVAKQQLKIDYAGREAEFEEIMSLTNPVVKKRLLQPFADQCDSAAIHLKAAAFPRQSWNVILPFDSIKDNEIYAPNYKDGERVILVRYPHGGLFEIPELIVNNKNKEARNAIGNNPIDAVGINKTVADRLSGADFDGDTVLLIPNNEGKLKTKPPLEGLKDFDTKQAYPPVLDRPKVGEKGNYFNTGKQMGVVTNLITDMTLGGANADELARAVRHSMVVIDAEKHNLDWQRSEIENGIQELKNKYQPKDDPTKPGGGVHTLISAAKSEERVPHRKLVQTRKDPKTGEYLVREGIDVKTGEKVYEESGFVTKKKDPKTGEWVEEPKMTKITKMEAVKDARELMSGPNHEGKPMERVYAEHANKCRELGNKARLAYLEVDTPRADPAATKEYAAEVASLKEKLVRAQLNAPRERLAQVRGNEIIKAMKRSGDERYKNYSGADWKKEKGKALERARRDVGAKKAQVEITDREWEAIQARAISPSLLTEILNNADLDKIKDRAMPKNDRAISSSVESRIKAYASSGRTQAEIAEALGISTSTVQKVLKPLS